MIILLITCACGVKGPPKAPLGTEITPWNKDYIPDSSSDITIKK